MILAAYLDGGERTSALAIELLDELVRTGRNPAVVSMVSVLGFYREFPNLVAAPVDLDVAAEAASLRVAFGFAAPDALIVATGLAAGASHLVTNDRAWVTRLAPLRERRGPRSRRPRRVVAPGQTPGSASAKRRANPG